MDKAKQLLFAFDYSGLEHLNADLDSCINALRYTCLRILCSTDVERCVFGFTFFQSSNATRRTEKNPFLSITLENFEEFEDTFTTKFTRYTKAVALGKFTKSSSESNSSANNNGIYSILTQIIGDYCWDAPDIVSPVKPSRKRKRELSPERCESATNLLFIFSNDHLLGCLQNGLPKQLSSEFLLRKIDLIFVDTSFTGTGECFLDTKLKILPLFRLLRFGCQLSIPDSVSKTRLQALVESNVCLYSCVQQSLILKRKDCKTVAGKMNIGHHTFQFTLASTKLSLNPEDISLTVYGRISAIPMTKLVPFVSDEYLLTSSEPRYLKQLMELRLLHRVLWAKTANDIVAIVQPIGSATCVCYLLKPDADLAEFDDSRPQQQQTGKCNTFSIGMLEPWFVSTETSPIVETMQRPKVQYMSLLKTVYRARDAAEVQKTEAATNPPAELDQSFQDVEMVFQSEFELVTHLKAMASQSIDDDSHGISGCANTIVKQMYRFARRTQDVNCWDILRVKFLEDDHLGRNRCRSLELKVFIAFELLNKNSSLLEELKPYLIRFLRSLVFSSNPLKITSLLRETLYDMFPTLRDVITDLADILGVVSSADDDDDDDGDDENVLFDVASVASSSIVSDVPQSISGISSIGSSQPEVRGGVNAAAALSRSSLSLSQRQIIVPPPKHKSRRSLSYNNSRSSSFECVNSSSSQKTPQKSLQRHLATRRGTRKSVTLTPRGRHVLKTRYVPETPKEKQTCDRIRINQEEKRRRSKVKILLDEINESPMKSVVGTPRKLADVQDTLEKINASASIVDSLRKTPVRLARESGVFSTENPSVRRLFRSPAKNELVSPSGRRTVVAAKSFISPSPGSLLHLTTSPVLLKR